MTAEEGSSQMEHAMSYFTDDDVVDVDSCEIIDETEQKVSAEYAEWNYLW